MCRECAQAMRVCTHRTQFWFDCQVDSFLKTFRCYCNWQVELNGAHWWMFT
jgi:hypothetical protein